MAPMDAEMPKARPRFLLATDLSPESAPHLRFAAGLARELGARVTLFHVVLPRTWDIDGATDATQVRQEDLAVARDEARRLAATLGLHDALDLEVVEALDARSAALAAAERVGATLIVVPTHGRTGLERAVLGSTAEQILRRSHLPVLLLTDRMLEDGEGVAPGPGPVVVATDLSPLAIAAHRGAAELAHSLKRPMTLLSVLPAREPPAYGGGAAAAPPPSDPQQRCREQIALLRKHAADLGHDRAVEVLVLTADETADAIVRGAKDLGASLLVLATHGRRGVARLLRGSVAERVVRHATVPVVCMPQPES